MEKKGWKILAIVLIIATLILIFITYRASEYDKDALEVERENIKSCAVGCYIHGYGNSLVDNSLDSCICNYPFNNSLPQLVKLMCDDSGCRPIPL